ARVRAARGVPGRLARHAVRSNTRHLPDLLEGDTRVSVASTRSLAPTAVASYRFEPLAPDGAERWDQLIEPYPGRELFHQSVWLDYLAASRRVEKAHWAIRSGREAVG